MILLEIVDGGDPPQPLPLYMLWDDILNAPVVDPTNVADWNAFYGATFTSVVVSGNEVNLYGGVDVVIPAFLFNANTNLLQIIDYTPCVIEVGASAFNDCFNLSTAILNSCVTVGDSAFSNAIQLVLARFDSATSVGATSFNAAPLTVDASFDSLITVGDSAFSTCGFTAVNFDTVTTIGISSFSGTASFANPSFPLCTLAGASAFDSAGCQTISFPLLVDIPDTMCQFCASLTSASFPLAETAGYRSFYQSGLTAIELPELVSAGNEAFSLCEDVVTVNLPALATMGNSCMAGLNSLVTLSLPSLTTGGDDCLSSNLLLADVSIPLATDLGALNIFADCPALNSLDIASMTDIVSGGTPFNLSTEVTFVNMPLILNESGATIGGNLFGNTVTVNVNIVLETIDGGNPAAWIITLIANNTATVNYIP